MAKMMGNDDNSVRDLLMRLMGAPTKMPRKPYKIKRKPAYNVQQQRPVRKVGAKAVPMPAKGKAMVKKAAVKKSAAKRMPKKMA